jgi:hypothetical protein
MCDDDVRIIPMEELKNKSALYPVYILHENVILDSK